VVYRLALLLAKLLALLLVGLFDIAVMCTGGGKKKKVLQQESVL